MGDDTAVHGRIVTERRRVAMERLREWRATSNIYQVSTLRDVDLTDLLNRLFPWNE